MNLAHQLYSFRQELIQVIQKTSSALTLRDALSTSKIQMLFADAGYKITVINLKCVLKELGFNWNGKICSIQQLLGKLKDYINPDAVPGSELIAAEKIMHNMTDDDQKLLGIKKREGTHTIIEIIKELFYSVGKPLYQIFREFGDGQQMEFPQFSKIVKGYSCEQISDADIKEAW